MKKFLISLAAIFIFSTAAAYSAEYYSYIYEGRITYAVAVSPSDDHKNEFIVGLLEIDPSGDERWTISTRTVTEKDNTLRSLIDVNFPVMRIGENAIDVEVNKAEGVVIHLSRVNSIKFRNHDVELPQFFR